MHDDYAKRPQPRRASDAAWRAHRRGTELGHEVVSYLGHTQRRLEALPDLAETAFHGASNVQESPVEQSHRAKIVLSGRVDRSSCRKVVMWFCLASLLIVSEPSMFIQSLGILP